RWWWQAWLCWQRTRHGDGARDEGARDAGAAADGLYVATTSGFAVPARTRTAAGIERRPDHRRRREPSGRPRRVGRDRLLDRPGTPRPGGRRRQRGLARAVQRLTAGARAQAEPPFGARAQPLRWTGLLGQHRTHQRG